MIRGPRFDSDSGARGAEESIVSCEVRRKDRDGVDGTLDLESFHLCSQHGQLSKTMAHVLQAKAKSYAG